jgi:hypothetical protein
MNGDNRIASCSQLAGLVLMPASSIEPVIVNLYPAGINGGVRL